MNVFRDTEHLYAVLDAFFSRVSERPDVEEALAAGEMIVRFSYREPEGEVTVDLRRSPIKWHFGGTALSPDLDLFQSADTAHQFWRGKLNVTRALATRKVVARGRITKALTLLPALENAYPLYEDVLRDRGEDELLSSDKPRPGARGSGNLLRRLGQIWRQFGRNRIPGGHSDQVYPRSQIPLADDPADVSRPPRRIDLPTDGDALQLEMLDRMLLIRAFEERLAEANKRGEIPTEAIHLSTGQEATAVGTCFALRSDDWIVTTHRGHGHMLAKGADLDGMMAEMLGKADGLCRGKGGSMHVTDSSVGALGANGIVGASALIAAGAAHSAQRLGSDQVAIAFMGDGATNQGMFHEAVNFAAVFDLPVVFVVENNLYGEFTPVARHVRVDKIADRAAAYGIKGVTIDGNDVDAVYAATADAVASAREGHGPILIECLTYRWRGHMEGDDCAYRPAAELESWKARCPIKQARERLISKGVLTDSQADQHARDASERVAHAWQTAVASDEPAIGTLAEHVWATEPAALYAHTSPSASGRSITYSKALHEALIEEMTRDERVHLIGEDVATGGYFAVTAGLVDKFGTARIIDTPISEYAIVGSSVGAAMTGLRPVAEILFSDFLTTCMDPLVNQAAKLRYMSGGQYTVPMVVRTPGGGGLGMAAQHSQSLEAWLTGIPGLIIIAPATPADAKGLLKAAIRSNNPVLFFENKLLYPTLGPVPEADYLVGIGIADTKRVGTDVTVVSIGAALGKALDGAAAAAEEGIEAEVVDVRTLVPLDVETIIRSVQKTGRLITIEDAPLTHGFGAEILARVVEHAHGSLRARPIRVAARDVPVPYCSTLETAVLPDGKQAYDAIKAVMAG